MLYCPLYTLVVGVQGVKQETSVFKSVTICLLLRRMYVVALLAANGLN